MLRSGVIARWEGSVLKLSVEAAGNNEPLSRAPGLQARRGAQDFRRGDVDVVSFADVRE